MRFIARAAFGTQLIALFAAQGCHVTCAPPRALIPRATLTLFSSQLSVLCRDASSRDALLAAGASSVVVADAQDGPACAAALATSAPALVVSAVGTSPPEPICSDADAAGTAALVAAAVAHAPASRFVLISALGAGESLDCLPHASQDVLAPWLERKAKAEGLLQASGLEWTVLRPGPLTDAPRSGAAVATLDAVSGTTGRRAPPGKVTQRILTRGIADLRRQGVQHARPRRPGAHHLPGARSRLI